MFILSQPLRAMDLNSEKGSSSWFTVLPFHDHQGFHLTNSGMQYVMVGHCLTPLVIVCMWCFLLWLLIMLCMGTSSISRTLSSYSLFFIIS